MLQVLGSLTSPESPVGAAAKTEEGPGHGHWQRRRRLDGALNRVPPDFYSDVWHILEKVKKSEMIACMFVMANTVDIYSDFEIPTASHSRIFV